MTANAKAQFPCPVCTLPRDVRQTKKHKPYIVCDPCGIQLFIRGPAGIEEFNRLLERTDHDGVLARIQATERRYRLSCSKCGCRFWIERSLVKTSVFDGSFSGFRCPQKDCGATVPWEEKK